MRMSSTPHSNKVFSLSSFLLCIYIWGPFGGSRGATFARRNFAFRSRVIESAILKPFYQSLYLSLPLRFYFMTLKKLVLYSFRKLLALSSRCTLGSLFRKPWVGDLRSVFKISKLLRSIDSNLWLSC